MSATSFASTSRAASPRADSTRLPQIEAARGCAAAAVFAHHLFQQFWEGVVDEPWASLLRHLGAWGVDVFFALSGFCIHASRMSEVARSGSFDRRRYLARRFFRIYPALLACLLLCAWLGYLRPSHLITPAGPGAILAHLTTLSAFLVDYRTSVNQVLWTVVAELHFYLLYALLWKRFEGRHQIGMATALAILIASFAWATSVLAVSPGEVRVLLQHSFFATFWTWCLGALVAELSLGSRGLRTQGRAGWAFAALLAASLVTLPAPAMLFSERFLLPVVASAGVYFLVRLPADIGLWRWTAPLGMVSYSLYLLHPAAIWMALGFHLDATGSTILAVALGLSLACAGYFGIESTFQRMGVRIAP
jgi:peptidoglycan/LPS O-acetylase OafA/YrhL